MYSIVSNVTRGAPGDNADYRCRQQEDGLRRASLNAVPRSEARAGLVFLFYASRKTRGGAESSARLAPVLTGERREKTTRRRRCYRLLGEITANDFPVAIGVYRSTNVPRASRPSRISTGSANHRRFPRPPLITPFVFLGGKRRQMLERYLPPRPKSFPR